MLIGKNQEELFFRCIDDETLKDLVWYANKKLDRLGHPQRLIVQNHGEQKYTLYMRSSVHATECYSILDYVSAREISIFLCGYKAALMQFTGTDGAA